MVSKCYKYLRYNLIFNFLLLTSLIETFNKLILTQQSVILKENQKNEKNKDKKKLLWKTGDKLKALVEVWG